MIVYAAESGVSAGALFMAGIVPGILAALLFIIYCLVLCFIKPEKGPNIDKGERFTWKEKFLSLKSVFLPLLIIFIVLGSIYLGIATPTEAGAVGSVGSLVAAGFRKKLTFENIKKIFTMTVRLNGMVFWILIGAVAYARIVSVTGVGQHFASMITEADVNRWFVLIMMIVLFLIAGMFIDTVAALLITAPLFIPALNAMGFDLIWFGVIFVICCCIGSLTPPFGISIFVMRGVAPDLSIQKIYAAVWPFVFFLVITMILVMIFPEIAIWLPNLE